MMTFLNICHKLRQLISRYFFTTSKTGFHSSETALKLLSFEDKRTPDSQQAINSSNKSENYETKTPLSVSALTADVRGDVSGPGEIHHQVTAGRPPTSECRRSPRRAAAASASPSSPGTNPGGSCASGRDSAARAV